MSIERATFENLIPSQFLTFTFPNPLPSSSQHTPYSNFLRIAVLDSPQHLPGSPQIAAMLVPKDRENDWIFTTETGHLQLLFNSPGISRLILVGNPPHDSDHFPLVYNRSIHHDVTKFEESLTPLLLALSPKSAPEIQFVTYEDNVIRSVSIEKVIGDCVGEMLVEDVEIEIHDKFSDSPIREFRRRLRFKRMPNLIQTEIRIVPDMFPDTDIIRLDELNFLPDISRLVHPYLPPMVASLSLIATYLKESDGLSSRPRVLCIGVGGGAVLSFLKTHFKFELYGIESDEMVMKVAKQYFGLVESELLRVYIGDGIDLLGKIAQKRTIGDKDNNQIVDSLDGLQSSFDVIMVDLDARDARNGVGAPPIEFVEKQVLVSAKLLLHNHGILVVNIIPVSKAFYDHLICVFRDVFVELYEINVENDGNYVLIATVSPARSFCDDKGNPVLQKLKLTIPTKFIDGIRKI